MKTRPSAGRAVRWEKRACLRQAERCVQVRPVCDLQLWKRSIHSMSFQEIILEVQKKPELWLSSHPLYKNRIVKAKVWTELAIKLGIKEDALKKRWKHMKDQYRKELKKQPVLKSGAESETWISTWQYFNIMSFVKDEVGSAPSIDDSNTNGQVSTHESENRDMESDTDTNGSVSFPISYNVSSPAGSSGSPPSLSSRKRSNIKYDMLEIEKKKLLLMETRLKDSQQDEKLKNDEDFLFLKSILPSMKRLNELQKLRFRGKINDWLLEALTENKRAVPPSSVCHINCESDLNELTQITSDNVQ